MTFDAEGWLTGATRRPGPAEKHGYAGRPEPGRKIGLVVHSMEGSLPAALSRLDGADRASWMFSNPKSGPLLQHYALGLHSWASGSVDANVWYSSVEHEGVAGEPLTETQKANLVSLIHALAEHEGWSPVRPVSVTDKNATLYEHRECVRFGSAPTACPSGRIRWTEILARLEEQEADAMILVAHSEFGFFEIDALVPSTVNGAGFVRRHIQSGATVDRFKRLTGRDVTPLAGQDSTWLAGLRVGPPIP